MKQLKVILAVFLLTASIISNGQNYPEMITVTGGTFKMGDTHGDGGSDEQPVHSVTVKTFKIAKTETTVLQWKTFCNATGRKMPDAPEWGWIDSHPIVNVSWNDAIAYTEWLSEKFNAAYRLPTEAEWEYAARGGNQSKGTKYSGSKSPDNAGWYEENSGGTTHPVAGKTPNELGLYDMSGNVWEWCMDRYGSDYYGSSPNADPKGPASGSYRVLRGGGWDDATSRYRVTIRFNNDPSDGSHTDGFRVVISQ